MAQANLLVMVPLVGLSIAGFFLLSRRKRRVVIKPDFGAFIQKLELLPPPPPPPPAAPLPLTGLTFAVKDIFDIEGTVTGFGNPDWQLTHEAAAHTAPAVQALIDAGATCVGKTHMDEMAYSVHGDCCSYGTPTNPAAHDCFPGGSSSGSAVAVAANLVDFAIGSDTAGSVRIPAAYCGVLGIRPSHGTITTEGSVPMAPSFDTVGVFARDPALLHKVTHILLRQPFMAARFPMRVLIADDLFAFSSAPRSPVTTAITHITEDRIGPIVRYVRIGDHLATAAPALLEHFAPAAAAAVPDRNGHSTGGETDKAGIRGARALAAMAEAMKTLQQFEFKAAHKEWLTTANPSLHPNVRPRVEAALSSPSDPSRAELATIAKEQVRAAMNELLKNDALLVLPTAAALPPKLRAKQQVLDELRGRTFQLAALGSFSGCPQLTLPAGSSPGSSSDGLPLAVSLMARHGADRFLLDAATLFGPPLEEEVQAAMAAEAAAAKQKGRRGGKEQKGEKEIGEAKGRNGTSPAEAAKEKGNRAFKEGRFSDAIEHYSNAIALDPTSPTFFANRAMAHLSLRNFQQVEVDCSCALKLDKKCVKAYLRRATAREFLGHYPEAFEDFNQALVLEPNNRTALEGIQRMKDSNVL